MTHGPGRTTENQDLAGNWVCLCGKWFENIEKYNRHIKHAERERKLVEALRSLRNECSGAAGIALPELHVALGNTNVACLKRRIEEADAALALFDQPVAPKETK